MPEVVTPGVDTREIRRAARALGGVFYRRVLGHIHNEMVVAGDWIIEQARLDFTKYFDMPTASTGLMA